MTTRTNPMGISPHCYDPSVGAGHVDRYIGSAFDIVYAVYKQLGNMPVFLEFVNETSPRMEDQYADIIRRFVDIVALEASALRAAADAKEYRDTTQQHIDEAKEFKQFVINAVDNTIQDIKDRFAEFIVASGYEFIGNYGIGIEITEYNQLLRDEDGEFWRLSGQRSIPYTTTGAGLPEDDAFIPVGDASLRQDLANPDMGAAIVARGVVAVDSIADLLALPAEYLREDLRYSTAGYHSKGDGGQAIYTISPTDTGYGIPLHNGLFLLFNDMFDIRKFGVVSDETLDQSEALARLAVYADSQGIYEIDFQNFKIMTPTTYHYTTERGAVMRGMGFRKPHHIKNLYIANNKTETLFSGTCPIHFLPDDPDGEGTFKLSNVKFDPYVADYSLASGEGDGMLMGLFVGWHPDAGLPYPSNTQFVSGYSLDFEDIEFITPAVSYNLSCHDLFLNRLRARNMTGDYWGIYLVHHAYELEVENIHGVFRDDLHAGAGRLLVTNLIQEEAEITLEGIITRKSLSIDNASCYKKSGDEHTVYKCHRIGTITINKFRASRCIGHIEMYGGADEAARRKLVIKDLEVSDGDRLSVYLACQIDKAKFSRFKATANWIIHDTYYGDLEVSDIDDLVYPICISTGVCENLSVRNIGKVSDEVSGLLRAGAVIRNIVLDNVVCDQPKLVHCYFETLKISRLSTKIGVAFNNFILGAFSNDFNPFSVIIDNSDIQSEDGNIILAEGGGTVGQASFSRSQLSGNFWIGSTTTLDDGTTWRRTATYDPPSIAAGATVTTTIAVSGAVVGTVVQASFSVYNAAVEISAVVSSPNNVTVRFKNTSGSAVDLGSGVLTVKLG